MRLGKDRETYVTVWHGPVIERIGIILFRQRLWLRRMHFFLLRRVQVNIVSDLCTKVYPAF